MRQRLTGAVTRINHEDVPGVEGMVNDQTKAKGESTQRDGANLEGQSWGKPMEDLGCECDKGLPQTRWKRPRDVFDHSRRED